MKIDIIVFDGFDELDALGPLEVLRTGRDMGVDVVASLVTLDGAAVVTGSHGVRLLVDGVPDENAELVIVPGGGWTSRAAQGAWVQSQLGVLPAFLAARHAAGATVAGVCTGTMLLATAGLTTGRPAITHHTAISDLEASGATVRQARVVDDGDVLTAGGVTSGLDLALWILERNWGSDIASAVSREIEYTRTGDIWRREA